MCTALQHAGSRDGPEADLHLQNLGLADTDLGRTLSCEAIKLYCLLVPWHSSPPLRCHVLLEDFYL